MTRPAAENPHKRRLPVLATVLAGLIAAAVGVVVLPASPAFANTTGEAEYGYIWPTASGDTANWTGASNGAVAELWDTGASVDGNFTDTAATVFLRVRAVGRSCGGAYPQMQVKYKNMSTGVTTTLPTVTVGSTDYVHPVLHTYGFKISPAWTPGVNYDVAVYMMNGYKVSGGCFRELLVDKIDTYTSTAGFFVSRSGNTLSLESSPYKFSGLNAYGMADGCDLAAGAAWSQAQLDKFFSELAPKSVTRIWAFDDNTSSDDTTQLNYLQNVADTATRYDQKLTLVLSDGNSNCDDVDGAVSGPGSGKTDAWYRGGYQTQFVPWAQKVVAKFASQWAVAIWEISNEPGMRKDNLSTLTDADFKAFFDAIAADIKALDSTHLVSTGMQDDTDYGVTLPHDYAYLHSGANIDLGSLHDYDQTQGVYGSLSTIMTAMNSINKPLVVGETGITMGTNCTTTTAASQGQWIKSKLNAYFATTGATYPGVAGVNTWSVVQTAPTAACTSTNSPYEFTQYGSAWYEANTKNQGL